MHHCWVLHLESSVAAPVSRVDVSPECLNLPEAVRKIVRVSGTSKRNSHATLGCCCYPQVDLMATETKDHLFMTGLICVQNGEE